MLVVDDHRISRRFMTAALTQTGCTVKQAKSTGEAHETALAWLPDAILTDWNLPGGTGATLVGRLRRAWPPGSPFPRTVLATGERFEALPGDTLQQFDVLLEKPFGAAELAAAVYTAPGTEVKEQRSNDDRKLQTLFRAELLQRIPEMDRQLANGLLSEAGNSAHQMVASAALCGETGLESALRDFENACRTTQDPATLAARWCALSAAAGEYLAFVATGR